MTTNERKFIDHWTNNLEKIEEKDIRLLKDAFFYLTGDYFGFANEHNIKVLYNELKDKYLKIKEIDKEEYDRMIIGGVEMKVLNELTPEQLEEFLEKELKKPAKKPVKKPVKKTTAKKTVKKSRY